MWGNLKVGMSGRIPGGKVSTKLLQYCFQKVSTWICVIRSQTTLGTCLMKDWLQIPEWILCAWVLLKIGGLLSLTPSDGVFSGRFGLAALLRLPH